MKRPRTTREEFFEEAIRYYRNAKAILREGTIEEGLYRDPKPVGEACGTVYRGVLHAIDDYLVQFGQDPEKLPEDVDEARKALRSTAQKNGKLPVYFNRAYEGLYLMGYYREVRDPEFVKLGFEAATWIIERLSGRKV